MTRAGFMLWGKRIATMPRGWRRDDEARRLGMAYAHHMMSERKKNDTTYCVRSRYVP